MALPESITLGANEPLTLPGPANPPANPRDAISLLSLANHATDLPLRDVIDLVRFSPNTITVGPLPAGDYRLTLKHHLGEAEARAIAADAPGRYLLAWDPATAGDLLTLVLTSAIKQAGHDLRLALESLEPTSWHAPEIAAVLEELRGLITTGQIVETEGSSQGTWAIGEGPLFCAAGANVLRDTKAVRPATFQPTVVPAPTMTLASKLPANAVLSQAQESFIIPRRGKNVAGAQELLRTMFSQSVASQFIEENQIPTTLRGALPVDPPGSLDTQIRLLERAGTEVINWRFIDHYGLREKTSEVMTEFLRGTTTTTAVITQLQGLSDAARADTSLIPLTIE